MAVGEVVAGAGAVGEVEGRADQGGAAGLDGPVGVDRLVHDCHCVGCHLLQVQRRCVGSSSTQGVCAKNPWTARETR